MSAQVSSILLEAHASLSKDPAVRKLFDIFLNGWFDGEGQEAGESADDEDDPEVDPENSVAALADGEDGEDVGDFGLQSRMSSVRHVRSYLTASCMYVVLACKL